MSRIGNAIITIPAGVTVDGKDYNVFSILCDLLKNKVNSLDGHNLIFCEEKVSLMVERTICSRFGGTFNTEVYSFGNFLRLNKKVEKVLKAKRPKFVYNINRNILLRLLSSLPKRFQLYIIKKLLQSK